MRYCDNFVDHIKAGYSCLYVQTWEEDRAINSYKKLLPDYSFFVWDIVSGLTEPNGLVRQMNDPLRPLNVAVTLPQMSVLFLKDYHRFISSIEIIRTIKNIIPALKANNKHLVFISPVVEIPIELQKDVTLLDFGLPTLQEILELARTIINDNQIAIDVDESKVKPAKGLTISECENAIALSLVRNKDISKDILENEKLNIIRKSGLMELYQPVSLEELGGLEELKKYIVSRRKGFFSELPTPKGILLFGVPGGGKSLSAKVIASVLNFPLLRLDIASLRSKHVGESEEKMRRALNLIDAVSPVVVWLDEVEKVIGGVTSSNYTDGGVTASMFGYLLTWLQENNTSNYIVATCNDIDSLLSISQGALIRRFDDVFFVDIPTLEERKQILMIMNKKYETSIPLEKAELMEGWTGAEIEKFVKASIFEGEEEAFKNIKPLYEQNRDVIEKAREWAKHNARIANTQANPCNVKRKITAGGLK